MSTANRIKAARLATGLSMHKFAALCGITTSSQSLYEAGKRLPTVETCYRIIEIMKEYGMVLNLEWLRPE
jgi:transcriptional regulator with XRE-family HTH domain